MGSTLREKRKETTKIQRRKHRSRIASSMMYYYSAHDEKYRLIDFGEEEM
jgi:hypothetical protein